MSNKICRKWKKFLTLPLTKKKREREEQKHNPILKTFLKFLKKFSIVTLVTNYHKLSLLPFVIRPWQKFENQNFI